MCFSNIFKQSMTTARRSLRKPTAKAPSAYPAQGLEDGTGQLIPAMVPCSLTGADGQSSHDFKGSKGWIKYTLCKSIYQ